MIVIWLNNIQMHIFYSIFYSFIIILLFFYYKSLNIMRAWPVLRGSEERLRETLYYLFIVYLFILIYGIYCWSTNKSFQIDIDTIRYDDHFKINYITNWSLYSDWIFICFTWTNIIMFTIWFFLYTYYGHEKLDIYTNLDNCNWLFWIWIWFFLFIMLLYILFPNYILFEYIQQIQSNKILEFLKKKNSL